MVRVGMVLPFTKYSLVAAVLVLLAAAILSERYLIQAAPNAGYSSNAQIIKSTLTPAINGQGPAQSAAAAALPDSSQSAAGPSGASSVTVNGQSIPVPQNGSYSRTIQSDGSTTTVNVQNQSTSTSDAAGNSSHNSLQVNVHSGSSNEQEAQ